MNIWFLLHLNNLKILCQNNLKAHNLVLLKTVVFQQKTHVINNSNNKKVRLCIHFTAYCSPSNPVTHKINNKNKNSKALTINKNLKVNKF